MVTFQPNRKETTLKKQAIFVLALLAVVVVATVLFGAIATPVEAGGTMSQGMTAWRNNMRTLGMLDKTWCSKSWYTTPNVCYLGLNYNWWGRPTLAEKYSIAEFLYLDLGPVRIGR